VADFLFTATAVVVQPITGWLLVRELGLSLCDGWIAISILLYFVVGAFWIPVVFMQIRMRNLAAAAGRRGLPGGYHRWFRLLFASGLPAFGGLLLIIGLMIAKPLLGVPGG